MRYQQDLKAYPTFSTMADLLELVPTLSDVGRHPEIAIAAYKPEVVINMERFEISARFQRILDIFDHPQHAGAISDIVRCRPAFSRQPEIAMAAYKPEVVITQERNEIEAKSQRLPNIFDNGRHTGTGPDIVRCRPTSGN